MNTEPLNTVIPTQPDWFVVYRKVEGDDAGLVERAAVVGWAISENSRVFGTMRVGNGQVYATPITVHPGDWLGKTGNTESLKEDGWEWETAHLPGGRRHQWEIDAAAAKSSNRSPGVVSNLTIFKP